MSLEIDGRVMATAEFREHAAADGQGAWIVPTYPRRLFTRNQAITDPRREEEDLRARVEPFAARAESADPGPP